MRFKTGLVVGGVMGYVLGARAGRQRYEQIKKAASIARTHPAVSQLADQTGGLLDASRYVAAASMTTGAKLLRSADTPTG